MDLEKDIALQNMKDASEKVVTIHTSVSEMQSKMRDKSMDFYYKLSLLSGGVLSLSITYLGYLASVPNRQIDYGELLFLSWFFLLVTIFSSIYRNHFNLDMGHYQTTNVLNEARLGEYKAALVVLEKFPQQFVNLKTPQDIEKQITATTENILMIKGAMESVKRNEKNNSYWWLTSQNASHIGFLLGMIFITIFAALNLPVPVNFSFLQLLSK